MNERVVWMEWDLTSRDRSGRRDAKPGRQRSRTTPHGSQDSGLSGHHQEAEDPAGPLRTYRDCGSAWDSRKRRSVDCGVGRPPGVCTHLPDIQEDGVRVFILLIREKVGLGAPWGWRQV